MDSSVMRNRQVKAFYLICIVGKESPKEFFSFQPLAVKFQTIHHCSCARTRVRTLNALPVYCC